VIGGNPQRGIVIYLGEAQENLVNFVDTTFSSVKFIVSENSFQAAQLYNISSYSDCTFLLLLDPNEHVSVFTFEAMSYDNRRFISDLDKFPSLDHAELVITEKETNRAPLDRSIYINWRIDEIQQGHKKVYTFTEKASEKGSGKASSGKEIKK
jgi:hypothetical protein